MTKYIPVIGLEVHIQLNTKTKLFCSCLNEYTPNDPNKNICPFCTGQPGALPVLNKEAVKKAIRFGVAVGANIPEKTRWDRKNYFYPDLPAGYQISQYDNPIVEGGKLEFYIEDKEKGGFEKSEVELTRAHLEADAAKLLHVGGKTMIDFNRSGAPLLEIVTEPVIRNADQAMSYLTELQLLARKIDISDADMEKGQMRFDCNLSLQTPEQYEKGELPSYKVELKNLNSVRSVGRGIEYEIKRQTEFLENGETPAQETRGWRDDLNLSESQRSKEEAHDYRYFPEPDLQILVIDRSEVPILDELPKLPQTARNEYLDSGLSLQTANTFLTQEEVGVFFERCKEILDEEELKNKDLIKTIANVITVNLLALVTKLEKPIDTLINEKNTISLSRLFLEEKISNQGLQKAIDFLLENPNLEAEEIVVTQGLMQVNDDVSLNAFVDVVLETNPKPVEEYKSGKIQVIGFLVGQCMKESKGQGNPAKFKEILEKKLAE